MKENTGKETPTLGNGEHFSVCGVGASKIIFRNNTEHDLLIVRDADRVAFDIGFLFKCSPYITGRPSLLNMVMEVGAIVKGRIKFLCQ
jgi:hypothetical protein